MPARPMHLENFFARGYDTLSAVYFSVLTLAKYCEIVKMGFIINQEQII